jgi:hypothetical protein
MKRNRLLLPVALAAFAAGLSPALADDDYIVTPMPPADARSEFVPPAGAVYVLDETAGTLKLCYPESRESAYVVTCTEATRIAR